MRGCDRFTFIGGKWTHHDASGNETGSHVGVEKVLKYPEARERYIFEMLLMPEYMRAEWEILFTDWIDGERIETLGPYPENGEYELIRVLEKMRVSRRTGEVLKREFVPLSESLCDALVATAKLNKELPAKHKLMAAQERRDREEKAKDQRLIDRIDDMRLAYKGQPFVVVPGSERKSQGGIILP